MEQQIQFTTASDGVSICYATSGSGPPVVKAGNWLSHLEFDIGSPVWRHMWEELSRDHLLVRYDQRGCGLSDWDAEDLRSSMPPLRASSDSTATPTSSRRTTRSS